LSDDYSFFYRSDGILEIKILNEKKAVLVKIIHLTTPSGLFTSVLDSDSLETP
jgi:hypothetical protein